GAWTTDGPLGSEDGGRVSGGFTSVWGAAVDDIYAVAASAVYHFDGTSWTQVQVLSAGSDGFGSAGNDVYAIDDTTLWHWNGMSWTAKTAPIHLSLGWANRASDIWLAGQNSGVYYDGSVFVVIDASSLLGGSPVGVATDMFTFNGRNMLRW